MVKGAAGAGQQVGGGSRQPRPLCCCRTHDWHACACGPIVNSIIRQTSCGRPASASVQARISSPCKLFSGKLGRRLAGTRIVGSLPAGEYHVSSRTYWIWLIVGHQETPAAPCVLALAVGTHARHQQFSDPAGWPLRPAVSERPAPHDERRRPGPGRDHGDHQ
jgi:hypothetical protein